MGQKLAKNNHGSRNWPTFGRVYSSSSNRSQSHDRFMAREHTGRPLTNQRSQPVASSVDQSSDGGAVALSDGLNGNKLSVYPTLV